MTRLTSTVEFFPFDSKIISTVEIIYRRGRPQVLTYNGLPTEVVQRVADGKSDAYITWPGEWRSDVFLLDDPRHVLARRHEAAQRHEEAKRERAALRREERAAKKAERDRTLALVKAEREREAQWKEYRIERERIASLTDEERREESRIDNERKDKGLQKFLDSLEHELEGSA